jgi:hypothetical protein
MPCIFCDDMLVGSNDSSVGRSSFSCEVVSNKYNFYLTGEISQQFLTPEYVCIILKVFL